jgi:hypothetical protein
MARPKKGGFMSFYHDPDQSPDVQAALQKARTASIRAEAAHEAAAAADPDGKVWAGTEIGEHCRELDEEARAAWQDYRDVWTDVRFPETAAEAQAQLGELDADLGPDPYAELDNELDLEI